MGDKNKTKMAAKLLSSTPIPRRDSKRQRVGSNSCPKCDNIVEEDRKGLTCSICELNYCIDCTSISKTLLVVLKEDMSDNFKWTCNGCKQTFPSLTSMTAQLKSIENTTINRLSIIEDKMNEMQHGMSNKIKEEVGEIKPKIVDEIKDEIRATLQEDVRREIREIEDQKIRAFNLIVFKLLESEDVSSSIRKDQDLKRFYELCSTIKVQKPDIKLLFRLGNPTPKRNRPLKIIFNNKKQRKDILDNASKIKNIPAKNCLTMRII
jgi:hypothetical protein